MKYHDLCHYFEHCVNAEICPRCLVPEKNSSADVIPYCFRRKP